jgi:hypothetical protein
MLLRQPFEARADLIELLDFAQDRFKRHGTSVFTGRPRMGGLQINAEWRQIATQKSTTSLPKVVLTVPFD